MHITHVGVDIAKTTFHVHAIDRRGEAQWRGRYSRNRWLDAVYEHVPCDAVIAMEACGAAHHWARELQRHGYHVRLIAAQFVKPYVKSNKNDRIDAAAICEALTRPTMRYVTVKSIAQQDVQSAHRVREALMGQRTATANHIRGLVGEYGVVAPVGLAALRQALPAWLEDADNGLSDTFRALLAGLAEDLRHLDQRVAALDAFIGERAHADPTARRLLQLRGVGPLTASALAGALGDGRGFRRGRDFGASLGLVPRQHSTGGHPRLLGISKRGDSYLRKLLVHGARAVIRQSAVRDDRLSQWLHALGQRKHPNVVTVALANKTARMAWALVRHGADYDPALAAAVTV